MRRRQVHPLPGGSGRHRRPDGFGCGAGGGRAPPVVPVDVARRQRTKRTSRVGGFRSQMPSAHCTLGETWSLLGPGERGMARTFPLLRSLGLRRTPEPGRGAPEARHWTGAQSLVALGLLAVVSVVVGILLGASADRLEKLGGLLLMVPAAIALQGKIFGALGSRLGTAIHAGTFRLSLRPATVVGENILAGLALSIVTSAVLAMLAKATAELFNIAESMSLSAFVVISVLGGVISSLFRGGRGAGHGCGVGALRLGSRQRDRPPRDGRSRRHHPAGTAARGPARRVRLGDRSRGDRLRCGGRSDRCRRLAPGTDRRCGPSCGSPSVSWWSPSCSTLWRA